MTATVVVPTLAPTNTIEPTPTNALAPTNTTEPTPTLSPTKAATPVPTPGDDEILTFLINALLVLNNSPNRMEVTTDLGDGNTLNSIIEFVPPDKKYIVSIKDSVEYLIVGNMVYAKTASTGIWEETQIPASNFLGGPVTEESISDTISSVQWSRTDSLDGKAVIVISYTSHTQSGDIELESQTEIWIGKDDGLPYKMIIDGEVLSASTDPSTGESKLAAAPALTTTLIDFDSEINIEKPIP